MNGKQEIIRMLYDHKSHIEKLHRRIKKLEAAEAARHPKEQTT